MMIYELESFNCETRNATSIPYLKSSHFKLHYMWGKQIYYHKFLTIRIYYKDTAEKILRTSIKEHNSRNKL